MKTTILIAILSLFLVGCADPHKTRYFDYTGENDCDIGEPGCMTGTPPPPTLGVDDGTIAPYLQDYVNNANYYGAKVNMARVTVGFGHTADRGSKVLAYCQYNNYGPNKIVINKASWDKASPAKRKLIITHELGHCERGLSHNTTFSAANNAPLSLMYPTAVKDEYFSAHLPYYMSEFFRARPNPAVSEGLTDTLADCDLHDHDFVL